MMRPPLSKAPDWLHRLPSEWAATPAAMTRPGLAVPLVPPLAAPLAAPWRRLRHQAAALLAHLRSREGAPLQVALAAAASIAAGIAATAARAQALPDTAFPTGGFDNGPGGGFGATGTKPSGTTPSGTTPSGTSPSGTTSLGAAPAGTDTAGTGTAGTGAGAFSGSGFSGSAAPSFGGAFGTVGGGMMGGLRDRIATAFAATTPATTGPAWVITPGITVQQEWTDNALQEGSIGNVAPTAPKRSSFITTVSPSISVAGQSQRVQGSLFYAPEFDYYASAPSQNRVGQNFTGNGLVTIAPDALFLDLRGFATQQALNGAAAPSGTVALGRDNQVQSYSFAAEPYLRHRFDGWATATVGGILGETTQGLVNGPVAAGDSQKLTTREEYASLASGENFGRLSGKLDLAATQYTGSGALQHARHDLVNYQAGYAITHDIIALASLGWEDITYTGPGAPRINDMTWSVGTKLTPNPDSQIILSYGHEDGTTGAMLDASYAITPRIRAYAHYATGTSSDAEQLQNSFANASLDPLGNPVDAQTGAPLALTNNFYGLTGTVYHTRDMSATLSWLHERDAVQLTVDHQSRDPLGTTFDTLAATDNALALSGGAEATKGTTGSVAWQHELSPVVSSNLLFEYGTLTTNTPITNGNGVRLGSQQQDTRLVVVSAGLTWRIDPTLSTTLQYSYTSNDYGHGQPGVAANLVLAGVRKTF